MKITSTLLLNRKCNTFGRVYTNTLMYWCIHGRYMEDNETIEFLKECYYCGLTNWCGLYRDEWHCGCLDREDE